MTFARSHVRVQPEPADTNPLAKDGYRLARYPGGDWIVLKDGRVVTARDPEAANKGDELLAATEPLEILSFDDLKAGMQVRIWDWGGWRDVEIEELADGLVWGKQWSCTVRVVQPGGAQYSVEGDEDAIDREENGERDYVVTRRPSE